MKNKKITLIAGFLIVAIILGGVFYVTATGTSTKANNKLELAIKYLAESKYEEAILAFQEVIKIEPKNTQAYRGLSVAYSLHGKKDQAEQVLQDGLRQVTDQNALKLALAGVLDDSDKKDQAETLYKELSLQDPRYLKYYVSILISHGKESEAETLITSSTDNNDLYESYNILAEAYFNKGEQEKALAFLNKSLTAKPVQTEVYRLYEKMYAGKWDSLISSGDELIGQNQVVSGQVMKLIALYHLGKYDEMVKQFDQASSDLKAFPKAITLMAEAFLKQGNKEQGLNLVKNIKTDDLKDAFLLANVAGYYLEAGDKETARKLATQGYGLDNTVLDNYVILYKRYQGEDDSLAKVWLMKYLLNSPYGVKLSKQLLSNKNILLSKNRTCYLLESMIDGTIPELGFSFPAYCYYDINNDILYYGTYANDDSKKAGFRTVHGIKEFSYNNKGPNIIRIHNPQLVNSYNKKTNQYEDIILGMLIPGIPEGIDYNQLYKFDLQRTPVQKGDQTFEDMLTAKGKSLDTYTFIDIDY